MYVVAIVSGGLDSVTLAHYLGSEGHKLSLLSVDYGQRHRKELVLAKACADRLEVPHDTVDLRSVTKLLAGSALTDDSVPVPEGHYADESMRATVVPNRNALMLSVATAFAVADKADAVATAVHAGDHPIYPDCRPAFVNAFSTAMQLGNEGFAVEDFAVWAPFVEMSKADIVKLGVEVGVPFAETWSCYQGREFQCGRCGTCVERIEAFKLADVDDPTEYEF